MYAVKVKRNPGPAAQNNPALRGIFFWGRPPPSKEVFGTMPDHGFLRPPRFPGGRFASFPIETLRRWETSPDASHSATCAARR